MSEPKIFYRYHDNQGHNGVFIDLEKWVELRETPRGYWIIPEHCSRWPKSLNKSVEKIKKWISKTSGKRFAYLTKLEAINNLIHRKRRQIEHCDYFKNRATSAKYLAEEMRVKIETASE